MEMNNTEVRPNRLKQLQEIGKYLLEYNVGGAITQYRMSNLPPGLMERAYSIVVLAQSHRQKISVLQKCTDILQADLLALIDTNAEAQRSGDLKT